MNNAIKTFLFISIIGLGFNSCKQNEVNGIIIGLTLSENQSLSENRELIQLIKDALNLNEQAIPKLINFPCGGAAGCYDLGFVLTQIIYQIGEDEFIEMILLLDTNYINKLQGLIMAGLEYGDNNNDGKSDNKKIEKEFPTLNEILTKLKMAAEISTTTFKTKTMKYN
ncbi:MAG: hypothetical protein OQJ96_04045 [Flavobacteriales bacterium]|nr:hypothetical protein [Flavobacteriales bacterium]MCW8912058.1 hypothetical protein [Flavobacteriales bacterium]MCW8936698.1 hypothetical protein [Flavobacteriales bacterium]MCW8940702.1 hypothetical protein [Flavobacteriales bacterium]MCW8967103.1 hypothetical protein [Flavobacteriales bacterium]